MSPVAEYVLQTGLTLLGIIALAGLLLYATRRLGVPHPRGPMELIGRLPLEPRRAICLVRIGERVMIVGSSEAGISKLGELSEGELPELGEESPAPFAAVLNRVMGRGKVPQAVKSPASSAPVPPREGQA